LRRVQIEGLRPALVLEDDVLLMPHFEKRLTRLWDSADELRNNSSRNSNSVRPELFVMLGFMSNGLPHREVIASFPSAFERGIGVADSLVLPAQTIGFFGYSVTAEGAAATLRTMLPLRQAMDSALHHSFLALAANNVQVPHILPFYHFIPFFICMNL
jgi:GR25 family glycosyltransferase involved in LPS biosynthesis